ncbi:hypothetical protein DFH06DRAFT_1178737, partial [Mycena polygramma]
MVAAAAEMVITLQWPGGMDVRPQLSKLRDGISSCFELSSSGDTRLFLSTLRDGMSVNAILLGRAYCTLRWVLGSGDSNPQRGQEYWCFSLDSYTPNGNKELDVVVRLLAGYSGLYSILSSDANTMKWALNVISAQGLTKQHDLDDFFRDIALVKPVPWLDKPTVADYLFSVVTFLSPINRGTIWMNKSLFSETLFEQLFHTLAIDIRSRRISMDTAATIVNVTGQIVRCSDCWSDSSFPWKYPSIIYPFCNSLSRREEEGWIDVILATGWFTPARWVTPPGWFILNHGHHSQNPSSQNASWVHCALDCVVASTVYFLPSCRFWVFGELASFWLSNTSTVRGVDVGCIQCLKRSQTGFVPSGAPCTTHFWIPGPWPHFRTGPFRRRGRITQDMDCVVSGTLDTVQEDIWPMYRPGYAHDAQRGIFRVHLFL